MSSKPSNDLYPFEKQTKFTNASLNCAVNLLYNIYCHDTFEISILPHQRFHI